MHTQQHALGSGSNHTSATLAEINALISDATLASQSWVSGLGYITSASVTYETLSANGDIGTGASTLCAGDDSRLSDPRTPVSHDNTYHSATYITASSVTYETLSANGDVGTGSAQVSQGNHTHSSFVGLTLTDALLIDSNNFKIDSDGTDYISIGSISGVSVRDTSGSLKGYLYHGGGTSFGLNNSAGERIIEGEPNSWTRLYYDNASKLETTDEGIEVNGMIRTLGGTPNDGYGCWITWNEFNVGAGRTEMINHHGVAGTNGGFEFRDTGDMSSYDILFAMDITGISSPKISGMTTASSANMYIDSSTNTMYRSTSSLKYKTKVEDIEIDSSLIYKLKPISYNSECVHDNKKERFFGLGAEDVYKVLPQLVHKNCSGVKYELLSVLLLEEVRKHERYKQESHKEILALQQAVDFLEIELNKIKTKLAKAS